MTRGKDIFTAMDTAVVGVAGTGHEHVFRRCVMGWLTAWFWNKQHKMYLTCQWHRPSLCASTPALAIAHAFRPLFSCLDFYFSSAWASFICWWSFAYRVSLHLRNLHHPHHWHHFVSRSTHFNQPTLRFLLSTRITKRDTAPSITSRQLFSQRRPSHAHHSWFCASAFFQSRGRFHFLLKHSGPNIR